MEINFVQCLNLLTDVNCGTPPTVKGANPYLYSCTLYGCTFEFTCRSVYTRAGNTSQGGTVVSCGADGRWDFGDLHCTSKFEKNISFSL